MINLNIYISEKLKIDKETKITKFDNIEYINTSDEDLAKEVCEKITSLKNDIFRHEDGRLYTSKLKMIIKKGHFCIRPNDVDDNIRLDNDSYDTGPVLVHYLEKNKLGHLYIIVGSYTIEGTKHYYYFFGPNGELFNDKKEAKHMIDYENCWYSPWDYKKHKYIELSFKPMKIEEVSKIPWDKYNSLNDIRYY